MSRPSAPSLPTKRQIQEIFEIVAALHPGAQIKAVGPEGVTFEHPDGSPGNADWQGKPFTADRI